MKGWITYKEEMKYILIFNWQIPNEVAVGGWIWSYFFIKDSGIRKQVLIIPTVLSYSTKPTVYLGKFLF